MNRLLLFLNLSLLFFASCGGDDDDDNDETFVDPIIGTWVSSTYSFSGCVDPSQNLSERPCHACFNFTFREDGTFSQTINIAQIPSESFFGMYTVSGNNLQTCIDDICSNSIIGFTTTDLTITGVDIESGCQIRVRYERQ
ncbi:MAG: hypothetical protein RJQ09_00835 [Cyclobacteriaceae bacterium]